MGADLGARLRRLERPLQLRLNRRAALLDLTQNVLSTLEPRLIAAAIVERANAWIPLTSWTVISPDLDDRLQPLAVHGPSSTAARAALVVARWTMRHDEMFASASLRADDRVTATVDSAALAFPLRGRERVIGAVVGLDRRGSVRVPLPGAALRRALDTLIDPVALALDAALLLKRTEELSVTDDLTRLYNSRYLNVALHRESRLAARSGRPLSLLFVDLDGFKSINDSHGHLAGSRALVEAGGVIRGSARETDIVARFGGDEFALILPDTGLTGALAVAERIRERIARHQFLAGDGLSIHLTASIGVATSPDVAITADALVQAADAAMYRVKDRGKNGIDTGAPGLEATSRSNRKE